MNIVSPVSIAQLKLIFLLAMGASFLIRWPYRRQRKKNVVVDYRLHRRERWLLSVVSLGVTFLPLMYVLTPWLSFADYRMPAALSGLGVGVMLVSLWMFWRAHHDLGKNWSPSLELREGHSLVCHGLYRTVRHPMYTSIGLWGVAQILLLPNWIVGPAGLWAFILMYFLRIPHEERMMREQFGDEYEDYARKTKQLIPHLF